LTMYIQRCVKGITDRLNDEVADYGSGGLQAAAKRSKDGPQARRLLALAAMYDGATRTEAAKIGGVGLQVVRDWVVKFNAQGPTPGTSSSISPGGSSPSDCANGLMRYDQRVLV
jgi:hypothetical protein